MITRARLRLVPRLRDTVTALAGVSGLDELHALARRAVREVPGLVSAEFFTQDRPRHPGGARRARAAVGRAGGGVSAARGVRARCVRRSGGRHRRPGGRRRGVRGRPRPALVLPGTPPGGGRVPRRPGQARRLGTRRAVGAARIRGGGRGHRRGPGSRGHYVRPRRRRKRAREHRPRGTRGRPPRGRGVLLRRFPRGFHLGRARHRRAQGTMACAGAHRRGTCAVRQDPFGARPVRHAEPERSPALIWRWLRAGARWPGR